MNVTYRQIKWLILIIPTLTIGLWEYVRHQFLLPVLSMEAGNLLAPVIVFVVTMTFLRALFIILEQIQEELHGERSDKAALMERERMARELHDGIAQSLFLLSVQADGLEHDAAAGHVDAGEVRQLRKTVTEVNDYVRHAIASLRLPVVPEGLPWTESVRQLVEDLAAETGLEAECRWELPEDKLSSKEKVELYACLREALVNVRKHAKARHVRLSGEAASGGGWQCRVEDDGIGFPPGNRAEAAGTVYDPQELRPDRYGLRIMRERAAEMGWSLQLERREGWSSVVIVKKTG
ncbi:sensor histidine kinase [Paenibacillus sp. y28]|uniref:sensor histidine kinase n=1 Tax=Paenibacillus sp. y28 TaxID=3129110 RepID=UPI0030174F07